MATFLDVGILSHFGSLFTILFVFVIVYGVLSKTKVLGENKGLHALIAIVLAFMTLMVPGVTDVIVGVSPWFVILVLFGFMVLVALMFLGVDESAIVDGMSGDWNAVHYFILVTVLIIFLGVIGQVYGPKLVPITGGTGTSETTTGTVEGYEPGATPTSTNTDDYATNLGRAVFHPKVLGMVLVLIIASFTIRLLANSK